MQLAAYKARELAYQKTVLSREFEEWLKISEADQRLEKHRSQVRRIVTRLSSFLDGVTIPGGAQATHQANNKAQEFLLGAHLIWDFFRSKLAMREVDGLRGDLACADELAWECYRPARERALAAKTIPLEALKEPPLVFFTSDASPFAQSRETHFQPEGITDEHYLKFGQAVLLLPIPVIGIPWFQLNHLPAAVVIAHEVGHTVERDFKLESTVEGLIRAAITDEERRAAWLAWQHEVFADVYGVLCCGPAYVIGLMSYLTASEELVQQEEVMAPKWGTYPTRFLRMELNFEVLKQLGLLEEAQAGLKKLGAEEVDLVKKWRDTYGFHLMTAYEPDLAPLVKALLDGLYPAFGGVPLTKVITFTKRHMESAVNHAKTVLSGSSPGEGESFRLLFAGAALAYYARPQTYEECDKAKKLILRFQSAITKGARAGGDLIDDKAQEKQIDEEAGREMLGWIGTQATR